MLWVLRSTAMQAQSDTINSVFQQLVVVQYLYNSQPSLNFKVQYTVADSSSPTVYVDSTQFVYHISNDRVFFFDSTLEVLQGLEYDILVYKDDSTIYVAPKHDPAPLLKLPLLDSAFRSDHIATVSVSYQNDSLGSLKDTTCKINLTFKTGSPYLNYEIIFNTEDFYVRKISYQIVDAYDQYGVSTSGVANIAYLFSAYSTADQDPAFFNEARYVYKLNGQLYLQPSWNSFQLQTF